MLGLSTSREGVQQALMVLAGSPLSDLSREWMIEDTLRGEPGDKRGWTERGMIEDVSTGLEAVTVPTMVVIGDRGQVEHESALRQAFGHFLPHAPSGCSRASGTSRRSSDLARWPPPASFSYHSLGSRRRTGSYPCDVTSRNSKRIEAFNSRHFFEQFGSAFPEDS
jgi:hypothetical protein